MPIFEYRCPCCGRVFEKPVQRPGKAAAPECPRCGRAGAEPILSATAAPPGGVCCAPKAAKAG